jgi:hypothetical protein
LQHRSLPRLSDFPLFVLDVFIRVYPVVLPQIPLKPLQLIRNSGRPLRRGFRQDLKNSGL